nr:MAG TPA: hypothetical protein [Caudoviricetes sp.]
MKNAHQLQATSHRYPQEQYQPMIVRLYLYHRNRI